MDIDSFYVTGMKLPDRIKPIDERKLSSLDKIADNIKQLQPEPNNNTISYDNTSPITFEQNFYRHCANQKMTTPEILKKYDDLNETTVKRKMANTRKAIRTK